MTHECNKEQDIDEIKRDIKEILTAVNGNGKFGLVHNVRLNRYGLYLLCLLVLAGIFQIPIGDILHNMMGA